MPQPMPAPPPPKKGMSLLPIILLLVVVTLGLAWYKGWFTWEKDPETGKGKVVLHGDVFKKDKDAAMKVTGEALTKAKDKIAGMMKSKDTATKAEDKTTIDKQIDELKKQLADLEAKQKALDSANDPDALKKATEGLDESVKKLLDNPK